MILNFLSQYQPRYIKTIIYMLQNSEYQPIPYLNWFWRTTNFNTVIYRRRLDETRAAKLLLIGLRLGIVVQLLLGLLLILEGFFHHEVLGVALGVCLIIIYPVLWAHLIVIPLLFGRWFVINPREKKLIEQSDLIFQNHGGIKIAIAGSYGKTSMKELLNTVLSQKYNVAATPANKNVSISHAQFAKHLTGKEDFLIIEYGEGAPGDVARFAQYTHPTHAVITGVAPAHLDQYKTLTAAGNDIFSLADYLNGENVYVHTGGELIRPFLKPSYNLFDTSGALGWKTSHIRVTISGTQFQLKKVKTVLKLQSGLLGRHHIGYLAFVAAFSLEHGLSENEVVKGIALTKPFEHRMQPYLLSGAWIIDDTYNGNIEGIRAGTQLLAELQAKRKIYCTPGLVDQGDETDAVHVEMGALIADAQPNIVVLMKNSVTNKIEEGLKQAHFTGEIRIEPNPLDFYTNLAQFVAAGDLVMMQNDWPDNYQ